MSEQHTAKPAVNVVVAINSSLSRILDPADSLHAAVRGSVAQGLAEVLNALGIPGTPEVEIQAIDKGSSPDYLFHIAVHGNVVVTRTNCSRWSIAISVARLCA